MAMINVNDVRKSVKNLGSLTAAVSTGTVYDGKHNKYARKRELNIVVTATGDQHIIIRQVPLFDATDLDMLKTDAETNKFLHIGCVTMSIEPLMHDRYLKRFGDKIEGRCMLVDATFRDLDESIISGHKYDLSNGRADYVCFPDHCLSLTDPHIQKRLSVLVGINALNVDPGTELFNLCIGYIITGVNTLHPTGQKGLKSFPISGTAELDYDCGMIGNSEFAESYNNKALVCYPAEDDKYFKSRGNLWSNMKGTTKVIKKRTMKLRSPPTTQDSSLCVPDAPVLNRSYVVDPDILKRCKELDLEGTTNPRLPKTIIERHRRSVSGDWNEDELLKRLNKNAIMARVNSRNLPGTKDQIPRPIV